MSWKEIQAIEEGGIARFSPNREGKLLICIGAHEKNGLRLNSVGKIDENEMSERNARNSTIHFQKQRQKLP